MVTDPNKDGELVPRLDTVEANLAKQFGQLVTITLVIIPQQC